jgi:hypothetical protein
MLIEEMFRAFGENVVVGDRLSKLGNGRMGNNRVYTVFLELIIIS